MLVKAPPLLKPVLRSAVVDVSRGDKREQDALVLAQTVHRYGVVVV
jgi:hypothetical protein